MDTRIALSGQQPNYLAILDASNQAAQRKNEFNRQNEFNAMLQQNGQGIMAGDQNALNALAQYDPQAALGVRQQRQTMAFDRERMEMMRADARQKAAQAAANMDAAERNQATQQIANGLKGAAFFYQKGDRAGYEQFVTQQGLDPAQYQFDQFPAIAASMTGVMEAFKDFQPSDPSKGAPTGYLWNDPNNPAAGVSPISGYQQKTADDYQRYVQEEQSAGRQPLSRLEFEQAKKGKGFSVTTADGTTVSYGGAADGGNGGLNPSSPAAMISSIDGILNDPALDSSTGMMAWTQNIPGTGARRFGARANQLEGQAFLQAFESLKGGGQITEIEGTKATQAIGRLDTSQSAEDYRQALTELREYLVRGVSRPVGWVDQQKETQGPLELDGYTIEAIE